ncbi:MAG: hypothetical protein FWC28_05505 [Proteobacteria bacterium]|nr:hypothetical protein [Cystobacterineae bacterium]MCL2258781.1 hypothetical protein [Cystobacterineae bacterium]MCL2314691.1 hypothetical protein [Pseudomonadota bacterium]
MEIALIIVSSVLVFCLYLLIFKRTPPPLATSKPAPSPAHMENPAAKNNGPSEVETLSTKTAELQKTKGEFQKTKEELRQNKQKLFEAREKNKQLEVELKTQKHLERQALLEVENLRLHSADLSTELNKLKLELETQKTSSLPPPSPLPPPPQVPPVKPAKPSKIIRELSPIEKEKIEHAERLVAAEHNRSQEMEKELKNLKIRLELGQRQLKNIRSAGTLQKDKFRALEKRLNRTLLEKDLVLRAMRELENRCGLQASIAELPSEDFSLETPTNTTDLADMDFADTTDEMESPQPKNTP